MAKMIELAEAAKRLDVDPSRVRVLCRQRRIPGARLIGRSWFLPEDFVVTPGARGPSETSTGIDLELEREWAEVLLASQDMNHVLFLLRQLPTGDATTPDIIFASFGIIATYCRPFTATDRGRIVGKRWTATFNGRERALHKRALELRHNDIAHTGGYAGRVSIHIQQIATDGIRYSPRMSIRGFTRQELAELAGMVSKIRQQVEIDKEQLGQEVLEDRVAAGYRKEFVLGNLGPPRAVD